MPSSGYRRHLRIRPLSHAKSVCPNWAPISGANWGGADCKCLKFIGFELCLANHGTLGFKEAHNLPEPCLGLEIRA